MSETYTTGGDTGGYFLEGSREAQTFIPLETHILHHIDLELRLSTLQYMPWVLVYETDENHHPIGNFISKANGIDYPYPYAYVYRRVRFPMSATTLQKGKEYAILIFVSTDPPFIGHWWLYDKDDATYPRGMRITTEDGGETWQDHPNDDLIFAEFGTPPEPPPPPEPPIKKVATLDIEQILTATGYILVVTTNVPSHLYMLWTTIEPEKHTRPILKRGLYFKDAIRYCFVDWKSNEQEEEGDTLYHTFTKEPWPECETRWFTFRAKVDSEWSPSTGPIFKKHRLLGPITQTFYPDAHSGATTCDGVAGRVVSEETYGQIRSGPGNSSGVEAVEIDPYLECALTEDTYRYLWRGFILFDTSVIPLDATIISAILRLEGQTKENQADWAHLDLCLVSSYPAQNNNLEPADYQRIGTTRLSYKIFTYDSWKIDQFNEFPLNRNGLTHITKAGITKLGTRLYTYDMCVCEPKWSQYKRGRLAYWAADKGPPHRPELVITYQPPS